jgi:diaminopimelate decarboxylase
MLNDPFHYQQGQLYCDGASLEAIAAAHGTPCYVYSLDAILQRYRSYENALAGLDHQVCFAAKDNSTLAILHALAQEGAGFDIVSGGELHRVLSAGGDPAKVVFSGVGKSPDEIRFGLEQGIHSFNCESEFELALISEVAVALHRRASIAVRVNPDVDAVTHPYISTGLKEHKFGVDIDEAEAIYARAASLPQIELNGVSCHIGSQLLDIEPLLDAADKTLELVARLRARRLPISHLDLGGGLGVGYRPGDVPMPVTKLIDRLRPKLEGLQLKLMLEPGRSIVAEAGALLTRVLLVKKNGSKIFVIVDAAMNDLIRPALYQAHHEMIPVAVPNGDARVVADVVGPVCESGDFFARGRELPAMHAGDLVAIKTAGAYGFVLASNYNSRPRPCEVLVRGDQAVVVRQRETYEDLVRGESVGIEPP